MSSERPIRCEYCRTAGKPIDGSACNFVQAINAFTRLRFDRLSSGLSRAQLHKKLAEQDGSLEAEAEKAKAFGCERIIRAEE